MQTRVTTRLSPEDNDPLTIHPPIFETPEERATRLEKERHAKEISDSIDEDIEREREARKGPRPIKILLLGQSESGKSTTLKNFQLMYDPKAFRAERASWRVVIQLNVVQSVRSILDCVTRFQNAKSLSVLTPELLDIKSRLQPLLEVEKNLIRRLTNAGTDTRDVVQYPPATAPTITGPTQRKGTLKEIAVNSATPWKHAFGRLTGRSSLDESDGIDWDDPDDPWPIFQEHSQDMISLWRNPNIKQLLARQSVHLEDLSTYFLDSLDRVTAPRYVPIDDDILHARLKTLGVSEHIFKISTGGSVRDWKVYDVGGHRSQRGSSSFSCDPVPSFNLPRRILAAWAPYFDDMDAIIFLAPISCFDQVLEEDHKINRLEDSFKLWTLIVSNPLLKNTNLILFLNKMDVLRGKLASGTKMKDYVVSYADRPNDVDNAAHYLRRKFGGIMQEKSPSPRVFYCHLTTVTDTQSTKLILTNLKDMLMRENLVKTNLIA